MRRKNILLISLIVVLVILLMGTYQMLTGRRETATLRRLVILYTNDEHGYLLPGENSGGAAGLAWQWREKEKATGDGPFLILSGGDMWTGPAISSELDGEATVDLMNALGYDAAALGNHDFDYGLDAMRRRASQADFPFLSANILDGVTDEPPDFVRPFTILEVNGIRLGVIGLTTIETPVDTQPSHVAALDFIPYQQALERTVPLVRAAEADLIVVAGHICNNELRALAPLAAEMGIAVIGGGHCHEETSEVVEGVALVQSGSFLQAYVRLELFVDTAKDEVVSIRSRIIPNRPGKSEPEIAARIDGWLAHLPEEIFQPIGYTQNEISRRSDEMARLVTYAWLSAYPDAQAALASLRYIQQPIPAGEITPASIIDIMPTRNNLMLVRLTGEQLAGLMEKHQPLLAGMSQGGGFALAEVSAVQAGQSYQVLMPQALYEGGNYFDVDQYDPNAIDTGIDWRQAVIDFVRSLGTSSELPLNQILGD